MKFKIQYEFLVLNLSGGRVHYVGSALENRTRLLMAL